MKKSILLSTVMLSATLSFTSCSKSSEVDVVESIEYASNAVIPEGIFRVISNNSISPGVNTKEYFCIFDTPEEYNHNFNLRNPGDFNYRNDVIGEIYVNITYQTVFRITRYSKTPGKYMLCGNIVNDKRYEGISYAFKFDTKEIRDGVYELTFAGESSPVFTYGDSFQIEYKAKTIFDLFQSK